MAQAVNHQNNFATNLTSNTSAGVTTTPLNSIPTIDAPYYIALDATNINSKYEVVLVTSDTATNINHAATTYAHTTAEEVRMVVPAAELDEINDAINGSAPIKEFAPQGFLQNGKISVTDSGAGLVVALKTLAGTDPSASDPVYCRIGDTVRTISAALSVTNADGTNWCNAGSSELATKEIDYFVYLGYNATDGVVIGFSRIPGATQYGDFSTTTTNEKYCAISTITNAASTDYYEVIGRFAATLSAGAGYTWSVPTFTAANLIQRPIYETRNLTFSPVRSVSGGTVPTYTSSDFNQYKIVGDRCIFRAVWDNASGGTAGAGANNLTSTLPFGVLSSYFVGGGDRNVLGYGQSYESAGTLVAVLIKNDSSSSSIRFMNGTGSVSVSGNDQSSTVRYMNFQGEYPI